MCNHKIPRLQTRPLSAKPKRLSTHKSHKTNKNLENITVKNSSCYKIRQVITLENEGSWKKQIQFTLHSWQIYLEVQWSMPWSCDCRNSYTCHNYKTANERKNWAPWWWMDLSTQSYTVEWVSLLQHWKWLCINFPWIQICSKPIQNALHGMTFCSIHL